jgi:hypothetical protein
VAHQNNENASHTACQQFNSTAKAHIVSPQQLVLLDEHSFCSKNPKIAHKWSGPHKILCLKGDCNVEIQLKQNRQKTVVHTNRLEPYFVASKNLAVCPDFREVQQPPQMPAAPIDAPTNIVQTNNDTLTDFYDNIPTMPNVPDVQHTQTAPLQSPSLIVNLPAIARHTHTRTHTASLLHTHTHTLSDDPSSAHTCSCSHLSSFSPVKFQLIMHQVMVQLLPILKWGGRGCRMKTKIIVMSSSLSTF